MAATPRPSINSEYKRDSRAKLRNTSNFKVSPSSPKQEKRTLVQRDSEDSSEEDEISGYDELDRCLTNRSSAEHNFKSKCDPMDNGAFSPKTRCSRWKNDKLRHRGVGSTEYNSSKKSSNSDEEEQLKSKKMFWKYGPSPMIKIAMTILIIVAIIFIVYCGKYFIDDYREKSVIANSVPTLEDMHKRVKRDLKVLFQECHQSKNFWSQVMNQVTDLFEANPPQPAILLVLIPEDSKKTAVCLVHKLQEIVSSAFRDQKLVMIDGKSSSLLEANTVKHQLDQSLSELNSQHVAIIHNLEKLPPEAAMILHAYCDNENAPHKRALIILTIGSSLPYDSLSIESANADIDDILESLWRDKIRDVDIPAILSRIANSPVLVKPEPNSVINSLCPYR